MTHFKCSKFKIDQARAMKTTEKGIVREEKVQFKRTRLNTQKCEHFLNFIFSKGLLQDVAYGTTTIKFDSGDTQNIPHAILQTKFSHTIEFYKNSYADSDYTPLSDSN